MMVTIMKMVLKQSPLCFGKPQVLSRRASSSAQVFLAGRPSLPGSCVIPGAKIRNAEPWGSRQEKVPATSILFFYANKLVSFPRQNPWFSNLFHFCPGRSLPQTVCSTDGVSTQLLLTCFPFQNALPLPL